MKQSQDKSPIWALRLIIILSITLFFTGSFQLISHPLPDLPLRSFFEADNTVLIQIEIDTRCFSKDPEMEPYLSLEEYLLLTQTKRDQLLSQAIDYAKNTVGFSFEPAGIVQPSWTFEFTTFQSRPPMKSDDPIMLTGSWRLDFSKYNGYRVRALPDKSLSVLVLNFYRGELLKGIQVLFPGESSRVLDLKNLENSQIGDPNRELFEKVQTSGTWNTFTGFIRAGFLHVLPLGTDHILFLLGLFLLSRNWSPLLWQISLFTAAHTITLGLTTTGFIQVSSSVVEPIIAGSIIVIALENIFYPKYSHWRLAVVFIFGLIHGLGFASALGNLALPKTALLTSLFGFNIGVEIGQFVVIVLAFLATAWIRNESSYRKLVIVPGSILIALIGSYWMIQRI